jgi:hypothetical protein
VRHGSAENQLSICCLAAASGSVDGVNAELSVWLGRLDWLDPTAMPFSNSPRTDRLWAQRLILIPLSPYVGHFDELLLACSNILQ